MHRFYVCSLFTVQADDSDSPLDNMDSTADPGDGVTWNKAKTETGNMGPGAEEAGQGPGHGQGHQQRVEVGAPLWPPGERKQRL